MRLWMPSLVLFALAVPAMSDEAAAPSGDERLIILDAMVAELDRSMQDLEIEDFEGPYFLSYLVTDQRRQSLGAANGAIAQERGGHSRVGYVEVRCGDFELDNSRAGSGSPLSFFFFGQDYSPLPIENDPVALRTALWQITDRTYKRAVQDHLTRQGEEVMRVEQEDRPDDFTPGRTVRHTVASSEVELDEDLWRDRLRRLSAIFNEHDWIESSDVLLRLECRTQWYVNSEGTQTIQEDQHWAFLAECTATAPEDGQPLEHTVVHNRVRVEELPTEEELREDVERLIAELDALRHAPVMEPYTGPALLSPDVTGVLFHEAIGHRLEGERQRDDDQSGQTFAGKIGDRILPEFISVYDDPTLAVHDGIGVNGHYLFDQEGCPAERVALVEDGVLRDYLMSRTPNEYIAESNGHGRSDGLHDPEARMGTLIVETSEPIPYETLRERLLEVCREEEREFGLIVRDIAGGYTNTSSWGFQAFAEHPRMVYRVDVETGEEELVRGVNIVGTPLSSINKIVAMGGPIDLFNGYCGSGSGTVPQAEIAPWALSTEVELQRTSTENRRPPLLPPPFALAD